MSELEEFLARYNPEGTHPVTEIDVTPGDDRAASPFIVIRQGDRVAIINPLPFDDYLDIDIHSFVNGWKHGAEVMGMTPGRRHAMDERVPLAIVLIGRGQR